MDCTVVRRCLGKVKDAVARRLSCQPPAVPAPPPAPPQDPTARTVAAATSILADLSGYRRSIEAKRPLAADGSPHPWYTYPAIEYLNQFDASGLDIFEFGCGHSSLYWARKGARVWCVEHDPEWHQSMSLQSSTLQGIALRETREAYAGAVHEPDRAFDIVVVDGVWRVESAREGLKRLKPEGIVILDNSDWYVDVAALLRQEGFFAVDFNGFGPINPYCWTTSIFLPWKSPLAARFGTPFPIGGIPVCRGEKW